MKKVQLNGKEITFDDLQFKRLSQDGYFECRGEDNDGNLYSGIIHKSFDSYSDIANIELMVKAENRPSLNFDLSN